ncbi:MAG TPA: hypothetical protein DD490_12680 [Acidobacteria bacterium]|nr:hypothetical protein [Acidobacteriota bacterium]
MTVSVLVQGAWALLLSHWSGQRDVVFGSTVAGRPAAIPGIESIAGLFINNLPVRAQIDPDRPALDWLRELQQQMVEAGAWDFTPPERVQEWSEVPRVRRLFDTLCVVENYPMGAPAEAAAAGSFTLGDLRAPVETNYLLTLVAMPGAELELTLAYDGRRLEAATVDRLLADLLALFEALPGPAAGRLADLLAVLPEPLVPAVAAVAAPDRRDEHVPPREPLEQALAAIFEEILDLRPIGVTDDFFALGGSSMLALSLLRSIQERLGRHLPLPSLVGGATVEQLAVTLRQQAPAWSHLALVPLQPKGERPPFFCVHSAGGMVLNLVELARSLGEDQPFYALQDPAIYGEEAPTAGVEELAGSYLAEVRAVQPNGPYRLGGHSFGAVVAFEMARQLHRQGEEVALVAVLDAGAPGRLAELPDDVRVLAHISETFSRFYGRSLALSVDELEAVAPAERLDRVLDRFRGLSDLAAVDRRHFSRFFRLYKHHMMSSRQYRPQPFDGALTLFRAAEPSHDVLEDRALRAEPSLGWDTLSHLPVAVIDVPGDHSTMLAQPQVAHLAAQLRRSLEAPGAGRSAAAALPEREPHDLRA